MSETRMKKMFYVLSATGAIIGSLALTRAYFSGKKYSGTEEMYGKTVVITGAAKGIGKETAKDLAKRGAKVILACRDLKSCEKARDDIIKTTFNKKVECMLCDLASLQSIKQFVDELNEREKFVHVLVNNAGIMWGKRANTKEGFEKQLGVNHMGHFYLTNLLLPKLINSSPSRIIVLTCKQYKKGEINFDDLNSIKEYDQEKAYNQSKLANVYFALSLSEKLANSGVTVNCVDPGYAYTDLMRNASVYNSPYSPISFLFKAFVKTAEMAAQSVVFACVSPFFETRTGKYIKDMEEVGIEPDKIKPDVAKRLWITSEKWTRLSKID